MSVNIPFNPYKIYQSGSPTQESTSLNRENTPLLCLLTKKQNVHLDFLLKVLEAAQIEKGDIQILTLNEREKVPLAEKGWFDGLEYLLCFGVPLSDLHIQIRPRPYQPVRIFDTVILPLPDLALIEPSRDEKQKLWDLLKKTFIDV